MKLRENFKKSKKFLDLKNWRKKGKIASIKSDTFFQKIKLTKFE